MNRKAKTRTRRQLQTLRSNKLGCSGARLINTMVLKDETEIEKTVDNTNFRPMNPLSRH
jgi:hypothetical protein